MTFRVHLTDGTRFDVESKVDETLQQFVEHFFKVDVQVFHSKQAIITRHVTRIEVVE